MPVLETTFHASTASVQLTLSVFMLGYAVGQMVCGPLSDRLGRRPVLLPGIALFAVAGLVCSFSPSLPVLIGGRLFQGMGASVGPILARAIVRDRYEGHAAAGIMSQMTQIMILAPMLAPTLGGFLLLNIGWHAIFGMLTLAGAIALWLCWRYLPETAKVEATEESQWQQMVQGYRSVGSHIVSLRYILATCFAYAGMFSYVSGAPFIFINDFHVPEKYFGVVFAMTAGALLLGATANRALLKRHSPQDILGKGVWFILCAGLLLVTTSWFHLGGMAGVILPMMMYLFGLGLVMPNATAAAMEPHGRLAGVVSSLMGGLQTFGAALAGYCVSYFYNHNTLSLAFTVAGLGLLSFLSLDRRNSASAVTTDVESLEAEGELVLACET